MKIRETHQTFYEPKNSQIDGKGFKGVLGFLEFIKEKGGNQRGFLLNEV